MDVTTLKSRLTLALVESIFRRAGYLVTPAVPGDVPPRLRREDLPDFVARRTRLPDPSPGDPEWWVAARYRPRIPDYLAIDHTRGTLSVLVQLKRYYPRLVLVFFTDHPDAGRSGFQALDLAAWAASSPPAAIDLFAHAGLDVYRRNIEDHEALANRILAILEGGPPLSQP